MEDSVVREIQTIAQKMMIEDSADEIQQGLRLIESMCKYRHSVASTSDRLKYGLDTPDQVVDRIIARMMDS